MSEESLLRKVAALSHEVALLQMGLQELNDRLESACLLFKLDLASNEDRIRKQDSGELDLVG